MQHSSHDAYPDIGTNFRISKRKRENEAAIEELARLDMDAKKRRNLPREEPDASDGMGEPDIDFAILMREHSVSLHQGLCTHWTCVCQKCSGFSLGLSLPQRKKGSPMETCFEVFFGVRYLLATTLQEAKITVK